MQFADRCDAGKQLAKELQDYRDTDAIVIGLPRGGVVVAYEIAKALNLSLDVTCPRKIGAPGNPEFAVGAVTERGDALLNPSFDVDPEAIKREQLTAQKRLKLFRGDRPLHDLADKAVIIVDDGLATGFTMRAAIAALKNEKPAKLVMAIPVAPPDTLEKLSKLVDEAVCLYAPLDFMAVGQFYRDFPQTSDDEVVKLLQKHKG